MAKKISVQKEAQVAEQRNEIEEKRSAREIIDFGAEGVIEDIGKAQTKLKEIAVFAQGARRPHKHFTVFANDLDMFVRRFKRLLR